MLFDSNFEHLLEIQKLWVLRFSESELQGLDYKKPCGWFWCFVNSGIHWNKYTSKYCCPWGACVWQSWLFQEEYLVHISDFPISGNSNELLKCSMLHGRLGALSYSNGSNNMRHWINLPCSSGLRNGELHWGHSWTLEVLWCRRSISRTFWRKGSLVPVQTLSSRRLPNQYLIHPN